MTWRRSPEWLVETFGDLLPEDPRIERRKMFGYPCAFASNQMFIGLHQENLVLRLGEEDRNRFLSEEDSTIFAPMPNRPMREYVVVPHDLIQKRPKQLAQWIEKSLGYVVSLPPKATKKKTAAKRRG